MPWCHECEKEFEGGLDVCPDCGAELYENIPPSMMEPAQAEWSFRGPFNKKDEESRPAWPINEQGEAEKPMLLTKVMGTQMDHELKVGMLEAYGFPVLRSHSAIGKLGKLLLGFSGTGMEIYVPESMYDDAKALLDDIEKDNLPEDEV